MKRLKQAVVGSKTSTPFYFEGEVKTFKEHISDFCKDLSDLDEVSFGTDTDGCIYADITKFSVESDEDYKQRLLSKKQMLEKDIANLNTELNQILKVV